MNVAPESIDRDNVDSSKQAGCSEKESEMFYNLLAKTSLIDPYRLLNNDNGFTWGLYHSKLRLDYILISEKLKCTLIKVIKLNDINIKPLSDHYPLYASIQI